MTTWKDVEPGAFCYLAANGEAIQPVIKLIKSFIDDETGQIINAVTVENEDRIGGGGLSVRDDQEVDLNFHIQFEMN
jgi:hypothetical protein